MTGSGDLLMVVDLNLHLDKKADNTTQKCFDMLGSLETKFNYTARLGT